MLLTGVSQLFGPSLSLDFLKDSGSTIASATVRGPTLTKTIASNAGDFDSSGNWAYAPHQLLENANLGTRTLDEPSGWDLFTNGNGAISWTDIGSFSEFTASGLANSRARLSNVVTVVALTTYTAVVYIVNSAVTNTVAILSAGGTNGTDGVIKQADFDSLGGAEGWYAVGFTMGADTSLDFRIGLGTTGNSGGTITMRQSSIVKGLIAGVGVGVPAFLGATAEPLGRWIGTDDGDEPLYDQPLYAHDPADSNAQRGLSSWEARTQLGVKVSDLADSTWTTLAVNADVPSSVEDDIFGTSLGSELACTATADQAVSLAQAYTGLTANTTTAVAAYAKTGTNATFIQLAWDDAGGGIDGCFCNFQLTGAGTAGTPTALAAGSVVSADIQLTTNGLYRCSLVGDIDVGTTARFTISIVDEIGATVFQAANLTDNDSLVVNATDVQVGGFITPHIPNSGGAGTSVVRARSACSTNDVSWVALQTGSFVVAHTQPTVGNTEYLLSLSDNGSSDRVELFLNSTSEIRMFMASTAGGTTVDRKGGTLTANTVHKSGYAWAVNDAELYFDGVSISTDTTVDPPLLTGGGALSNFHIGARYDGGTPNELNGYIQFIKYFNVRKPDAFMNTETT